LPHRHAELVAEVADLTHQPAHLVPVLADLGVDEPVWLRLRLAHGVEVVHADALP